MNGTPWYAPPARLLREGAPDAEVGAAIVRVGGKPISDGAAPDAEGNHFFTNLSANGIDVLDKNGALRPLVRDARLLWPDNAHFGPDSWLYVAVNQLHRNPIFSGAADQGQPPYLVARVWTGTRASRAAEKVQGTAQARAIGVAGSTVPAHSPKPMRR